MRILGIDPGISGALGLFLTDSTVHTIPNGLVDLPVVGEGSKRELNYAALRDIVYEMNPDIVVLERAMAMPSIPGTDGERRTMGAASAFKFGGGYYAIKAVVACLDRPLHPPVMPGVWKKYFNLPGGEAAKEASRQLAIQRYPQVAPFLTRRMDHQRAEAFLIAVWYAETGGRSIASGVRAKRKTVAPVFDGIDDIPE